jgi:hypothetical protein
MFVISVLHFGLFGVNQLQQFSQQDRQSKYNVTLRLDNAIIVVVEKKCVLHILSVRSQL